MKITNEKQKAKATHIKDIIDFCESFAPFSEQESWDNSGLNIGNKNKKVSSVLVTLDITKDVIKEAIRKKSDLIISHHPIIFDDIKSIDFSDACSMLIKNDISALCIHTNLDKAEICGVNTELANALNIKNSILYKDEFLRVGVLDKAMTATEFASFVKEKLNCTCVKFSDCKKKIKKVAVSSGAGGYAVSLFDKYGFDALVTGEAKYHQFIYAKDNGFCVVSAGHFATENIVIKPLFEKLRKEFPSVDFYISKTHKDVENAI